MATVTGMTAAAMEAIRDGAVNNGYINSSGHLILVQYDGTLIDAGAYSDASTTVKGVVELATEAETIAGLDDLRAVTPKGLAALSGYRVQVLDNNSRSESATPDSYPVGVSLMALGDPTWSINSGNGFVVTQISNNTRNVQTFYASAGGSNPPMSWTRIYHPTAGGGGWTAWAQETYTVNLATSGFSQTTALTSYPLGHSRLYFTAGGGTGWDFNGKAGEVLTFRDTTGFGRQVFNRYVASTGIPEMWTRGYGSGGWSKWVVVAGNLGWNNLTYVSGFTAGTSGQLEYSVTNGVVYIRGSANGTFPADTYNNVVAVGGIPADYRPSNTQRGGAMGTSFRPCGFEVNSDGSIKLGWSNLSSAPSWISFSTSYPLK